MRRQSFCLFLIFVRCLNLRRTAVAGSDEWDGGSLAGCANGVGFQPEDGGKTEGTPCCLTSGPFLGIPLPSSLRHPDSRRAWQPRTREPTTPPPKLRVWRVAHGGQLLISRYASVGCFVPHSQWATTDMAPACPLHSRRLSEKSYTQTMARRVGATGGRDCARTDTVMPYRGREGGGRKHAGRGTRAAPPYRADFFWIQVRRLWPASARGCELPHARSVGIPGYLDTAKDANPACRQARNPLKIGRPATRP